MTASDQVRSFVREHYLAPARRRGARTVTIRAGEVHKALKWDLKRVPQVCSALSAQKFLRSANIELIERKGPPSGQSTTVEFTFRLLHDDGRGDAPARSAPAQNNAADGSGLLDLFGIFEEEFRVLGGGEAFLKAERSSWGPDPWQKYETDAKSAKKAAQ